MKITRICLLETNHNEEIDHLTQNISCKKPRITTKGGEILVTKFLRKSDQ
ncbi:hypothetical protein HNR53_001704 [Bacillus benzoevorans]|uniref:Uncharacterized protein n=1 Tax=Bacillus benzoevorans TaxID=1456 RepID=A0A7X0LW88_9BACI|nr:hypothetical protein [Bacillus benzoevorans]